MQKTHHLHLSYTIVATIIAILIISFLSLTVSASEQIEKQRYIVTFDTAPGASEQAMVRAQGGDVIYSYSLISAMAVSIPEQAIQGLKNSPHVLKIEQDQEVYATDIEMDNSWGVTRIGAEDIHTGNTVAGTNKGEDIKIGIIDSGINYFHPDLDDNYAGGYDFVTYDEEPMDVYGHGTHVAGTACAEDNANGDDDPKLGVVGVAPLCDLYALRVLNDDGVGYETDIMAAIEWALGRDVYLPAFGRGRNATPATNVQGTRLDIVNLSLGRDGAYLDSSEELFEAAALEGLVIVAAAGNSNDEGSDGTIVNTIYPANYPSVIAVAATNIDDERAYFSSTGPLVEIAAPGEAVYSTWNDELGYYTPNPVCTGDLVDINGDGELDGECYKYGSGTSMASPHVAGVAALIMAAGITDGKEVRSILQETAEDLGDEGRDSLFGFGLVDATAAVLRANNDAGSTNTAPSVQVLSPLDGSTIDGAVTLSASATDTDGDTVTVEFFVNGTSLGNGTLVSENYEFTWTPLVDEQVVITATASDGDKTASDSVTITVNMYNDAPVADAGDDQSLVDTDNDGFVSVTLDGSQSYDLDLDTLSYVWTDEGGTELGTETTLVKNLEIGIHTFTLTVSDETPESSADDVTITVVAQELDVSTKFSIGSKVLTTSDLNVRDAPDGTYLGTQPRKTVGYVTDGPVWAGGYWWWEIDYEGALDTLDGWSVERFLRSTR